MRRTRRCTRFSRSSTRSACRRAASRSAGTGPSDPRQLATIKLNYPKITADAGPCGVWPEDLGPTFKNRIYQENKPYYNLGCAYQRNMAAMVANPSDLIQPRPEAPSSATRRSTVLDKYGKSQPTAVTYPDADKGKLSDVGK